MEDKRDAYLMQEHKGDPCARVNFYFSSQRSILKKKNHTMKKISGLVSCIGSIVGFFFMSFAYFKYSRTYDEDLVLSIGVDILCISTIYYTVSTKFWTSNLSVIESLEKENEIIEKQIEKRELLAKLETLEKK